MVRTRPRLLITAHGGPSQGTRPSGGSWVYATRPTVTFALPISNQEQAPCPAFWRCRHRTPDWEGRRCSQMPHNDTPHNFNAGGLPARFQKPACLLLIRPPASECTRLAVHTCTCLCTWWGAARSACPPRAWLAGFWLSSRHTQDGLPRLAWPPKQSPEILSLVMPPTLGCP